MNTLRKAFMVLPCAAAVAVAVPAKDSGSGCGFTVPFTVDPQPCNCDCDDGYETAKAQYLKALKDAYCACPALPLGFECRAAALKTYYDAIHEALETFDDCVESEARSPVGAVLTLVADFESAFYAD